MNSISPQIIKRLNSLLKPIGESSDGDDEEEWQYRRAERLKRIRMRPIDAPLNLDDLAQRLSGMSLKEIGILIFRCWKDVEMSAYPYVDTIRAGRANKFDIMHFIDCSCGWTGDAAKMIKAELNKRAKLQNFDA